ncbi:MAG TPA: DUF308 domain-containing protein [Microthrixaceae bacterium]|nr:DUF308 domain-containing protein [Microthrixaceae bacterium]
MSYEVQVEARELPSWVWIAWVVGGLVSAAIGVWLIASPNAAIGTLAILLAIGLLFNGMVELVNAQHHDHPGFSYLLAAIFLVAGLLVLFRPGKSLWFLAVVVGISIIITGIGDIVLSFVIREGVGHWLLMLTLGVVGVIAGILAIAWPQITIWVLALLIGVRLVIFGILQIAIGFGLRSVSSQTV